MPRITSQRDAREVRALPFCYLCGQPFDDSQEQDRDHVPPQAVFLPEDRENFPLCLPTHAQCNNERSEDDEAIGHVISLLHGTPPEPNRARFEMEGWEDPDDGERTIVLSKPDLQPLVFRWIQAFHAALYREPLLRRDTRASLLLPFPTGQYVDDEPMMEGVHEQFKAFTRQIKRARAAKTTDLIQTNNGKLTYECTWPRSDRGYSFCMFGLRLYDWGSLADRQRFEERECVGSYQCRDGPPASATRATELVFSVDEEKPLDPFA